MLSLRQTSGNGGLSLLPGRVYHAGVLFLNGEGFRVRVSKCQEQAFVYPEAMEHDCFSPVPIFGAISLTAQS